MIFVNIANRLNELMQRNGTSNYKLAKALGCSPSSGKNWRDGNEIKLDYVSKIAEYYRVTMDYLAGIEKEPEAYKGSELLQDNIRGAVNALVDELDDTEASLARAYLQGIIANRKPKKAVHGTSGEIPALLALHGLRRSEVYALRWEDVDLHSGLLHVRRSAVIDRNNELVQRDATKTEAGTRTVPIMIPELRAALEAAEGREGLVVRQSIAYLYQQVNEACGRAGLPLVGVHGLRHSFASLAYHLGWGEMETMSVGGWSDRETMHRIYTHLAETDREKAQKKMEKFYKNANRNA